MTSGAVPSTIDMSASPGTSAISARRWNMLVSASVQGL